MGIFCELSKHFQNVFLIRCKNFLKIHKTTGEKSFSKYVCGWLYCKNSNTIDCDDNNHAMFPDTRVFGFTRQPMKQIFTWSTRVIHLHSSLASLSWLKFWFAKKWRWTCVLPRQERDFTNYRDHAEILVVFNR